MKQSLTRYECIKSKSEFQKVFTEGKNITVFPLRCLFIEETSKIRIHKIGVAVSKKKIKKAAFRNIVKRRIREAYRKNKHLIAHLPPHMLIWNYLSSEILPYQEIEAKIVLTLQRLSGK